MSARPAYRRSRSFGDAVSTSSRVLRREWPLIGIGLFALILRGHQLLEQVPIDDEWHALYQAMTHRMGAILTRFGANDISIPIAAYYKTLIATVGLTSFGVRLPFLLFGVATVIGFPLMVRPFVGRPAANVLAALLAVSPMMVFFSRFARPYAIALLCALGAAMAFRTWWISGGKRWAAAYVALSAIACWLLLILAPFVLGTFVLAWAIGVSGPRRAALGRLVRLGAVTLLALAVLIGPPLWVDSASLFSKVGGTTIRFVHLYDGAVFALGNDEVILAFGMTALAVTGIVVLVAREPRFAGYLAGLCALQVAGFVLARPSFANLTIVSSRYLLPVLAVTLMFASVGIVALGNALGRAVAGRLRPAVSSGLACAVCGVVLLWSPIPLIAARPNAWASQYLGRSLEQYGFYAANIRSVPEFYETLASLPPESAPIVEVPSNVFTFFNPLPFYQRVHRQPVLIGMLNGQFGPPAWGEVPSGHGGIRLDTYVALSDIETMRRRGVRFVIVHRDLYEETKMPPNWIGKPVDMRPCVEWLETQLGAPVFEGQSIVVFQVLPVAPPVETKPEEHEPEGSIQEVQASLAGAAGR
jgi:hypothetical protein